VTRAAALFLAALVSAGCVRDSEPQPVRRHLVYSKGQAWPNHTIWIGDVDGRNMRRLTRGEYGLVSPRGDVIAITRPSGVRLIRPDGVEEREIGRGRAAGWFADSRHLLLFRRNALVSVDTDDGDETVLVPDTALLRGWAVSPNGERLAYGLARKETRSGECGEYIDLHVVDSGGGSRRQLTHDGRSSDPIWGGDGRIAFAREPVKPPCAFPKSGLWTIHENGGELQPVVPEAPRRFAWNGYYGLRPYAFASGRSLLVAGVRTEWGDELALVDMETRRIRKPDLDPRPRYRRNMYVDYVSRNGSHVLATACGAEYPCTISIYSVLRHQARHLVTGRVGDAHWNR
jgi:dipeptidyl aminopeptidase/acylaminoacyl peptidase